MDKFLEEIEELDYIKDMEIDEMALDVEWLVTQPKLAAKYNKHYSIIFKDFLLAHEEVKTVRSELIRKANQNPQKCCFKPKPNKEDIEAYYRVHPKYKRVKRNFIDIETEKIAAEHAKNEINFTRKAALENAIELLGQSYFAGPKMPRNLHKESNKRREELNHKNQQRISKTMKRKKRS